MKFGKRFVPLALLMALWSVVINASFAGQSPNGANHGGASSTSRRNAHGAASNAGQWSADPERGWVRDDDQRRSNEQHISTPQSSQNKAKQKDRRNKS
ncbi:MAG TPA: hypothetical protein VEI95_05800 [Acidobacteriota bacterium]|nr:hypothetical protein [Acidobacteriota bacterium]